MKRIDDTKKGTIRTTKVKPTEKQVKPKFTPPPQNPDKK